MPRPRVDGIHAISLRQRSNRVAGTENPEPPILVSPAEAARQLSLSRYTVYELVKADRMRASRYGSKILIPRGELERFAGTLEQK